MPRPSRRPLPFQPENMLAGTLAAAVFVAGGGRGHTFYLAAPDFFSRATTPVRVRRGVAAILCGHGGRPGVIRPGGGGRSPTCTISLRPNLFCGLGLSTRSQGNISGGAAPHKSLQCPPGHIRAFPRRSVWRRRGMQLARTRLSTGRRARELSQPSSGTTPCAA